MKKYLFFFVCLYFYGVATAQMISLTVNGTFNPLTVAHGVSVSLEVAHNGVNPPLTFYCRHNGGLYLPVLTTNNPQPVISVSPQAGLNEFRVQAYTPSGVLTVSNSVSVIVHGLTVSGYCPNTFSFSENGMWQNIGSYQIGCFGQFQTNCAGGFYITNAAPGFYGSVSGYRLIISSNASFGNYQDTIVTSGMLTPQYTITNTLFPGDDIYLQLQIQIPCNSSVFDDDEIGLTPFVTWGYTGSIDYGYNDQLEIDIPSGTFQVLLDSAIHNGNSLRVIGSYDFSNHLFEGAITDIQVMYGDTFSIPVAYDIFSNSGTFDTTLHFSGNNLNSGYTIAVAQSVRGCVTATSFVATSFVSGVGVEDVSINMFNLYPNPTTNNISFSLDKNDEFEIINPMGQVVFRGNGKIGENTISLVDLPSGVYYFRSSTTVFQQKFLKN